MDNVPKHIVFLLATVLFVGADMGLAQKNLDRPNVLIIFTDDQGSLDMNCYGSRDLVTPNMDAIAARGVRFTQFYAAAPVCSPSRAALLTGKVPLRAKLTGNVAAHLKDRGIGLPTEQVTIAEMLKASGYATAQIGKWHLGNAEVEQPRGQGFDYSFGHLVGCIDNYSHFFFWEGPNRHDLWRNGEEVWYDGEYFPDLTVKEVNQFMDMNQDTPFFIYWALNLPHYPYQGKKEWLDKYSGLESPRREYAAFISTMDEKIGEVLKKLDDLGLRDNTLIILQSDHGHSREDRAMYGGGNAGPYRGAKFSMFEAGLRVPAIISLPGRIPENEVRGQLATGMDWLPTLAELCQVDLPRTRLDGKSLVPVIQKNAASPHEVVHWQYSLKDKSGWAVRSGDWKLLGYPKDPNREETLSPADSLFLVDLSKDLSETTNLSEDFPKKVEAMKKLHDEWLTEILSAH